MKKYIIFSMLVIGAFILPSKVWADPNWNRSPYFYGGSYSLIERDTINYSGGSPPYVNRDFTCPWSSSESYCFNFLMKWNQQTNLTLNTDDSFSIEVAVSSTPINCTLSGCGLFSTNGGDSVYDTGTAKAHFIANATDTYQYGGQSAGYIEAGSNIATVQNGGVLTNGDNMTWYSSFYCDQSDPVCTDLAQAVSNGNHNVVVAVSEWHYTGGSGCVTCGGGGVTGNVNWAYPTSSVQGYPTFPYFVVNLTNLTSAGNPYSVRVNYQNSDGVGGFDYVQPIYNDSNAISVFGDESTTLFQVVNSVARLNSSEATTSWYAEADLYSADTLIDSATTTFILSPFLNPSLENPSTSYAACLASGCNLPNSSGYNGNGNGNGFLYSPYQQVGGGGFSLNLVTCVEPTSSLDLGWFSYAGCFVLATLFNTPTSSFAGLQGSMQFFLLQPPFSVFSNFAAIVQSSIVSTTAYQNGDFNELVFNQSTTVLGNTPIILMTSSSMDSFIGHDANVLLRQDEDYALWVILGLLMAFTVYYKVIGS